MQLPSTIMSNQVNDQREKFGIRRSLEFSPAGIETLGGMVRSNQLQFLMTQNMRHAVVLNDSKIFSFRNKVRVTEYPKTSMKI